MVIAGRLAVHLPSISSIFQTLTLEVELSLHATHGTSTMVAFVTVCNFNYNGIGGFDISMYSL